eukprot:CAMPEP_0198724638 /NCGR_PEP_ID=MMETSP1475-20131203/2093_1 /TAXON_ID= ORGANISM="Unidentified sp., Strain CCMP1999" /NCGR_SAMPLE_ID=MMETSP1475 /ASSEMBLY_ACC=CAM_ASM_001111 /LENGTH=194 /DNA_ID=CAMNT_0044486225 /DNA_START=82 /DNA_END=667 /DNA_ORIENTATION=+
MKSVVAVMAAVLLTLGVSAAVMNRDTTEESHVALSDDQMSVRYKAPSCCRAFRWISFLDDKDKYSVKQMLYNCRMDERAKKCKIDCSNQKTTQGCKCCCDMKEAMGILKGKNSDSELLDARAGAAGNLPVTSRLARRPTQSPAASESALADTSASWPTVAVTVNVSRTGSLSSAESSKLQYLATSMYSIGRDVN